MTVKPGDSAMRAAMTGQAKELAGLLADDSPIESVAARLAGKRVLVVGTGTSWHAAEQGAWLLRLAGVRALAAQSASVAVDPVLLDDSEVVVALSHTGGKQLTPAIGQRAAEGGLDVVRISGLSAPEADLRTVEREKSSAYTVSHLAALLRLAQVADALGAPLGALPEVPDAVEDAFRQSLSVPPPERLIEFIGAGINQWTAYEGALKIREAAYLASEGMSAEQFLHGPSVALRGDDRLVCLDGGGAQSERVREIASAAERSGVPTTVVTAYGLGEALSIFPLTVAVQQISLECAEVLGVNPDSFGRDVPGREPWAEVEL